jgi:hypothetical protein
MQGVPLVCSPASQQSSSRSSTPGRHRRTESTGGADQDGGIAAGYEATLPLARALASHLSGCDAAASAERADGGMARVLEALERASLHNSGEEAACPFSAAAALAAGASRAEEDDGGDGDGGSWDVAAGGDDGGSGGGSSRVRASKPPFDWL